MRASLRIVLLFGMIAFAIPVSAQILDTGVATLTMQFSPANPGPGTTVHVTLSSPTVDLDRTNIDWYINGKHIVEDTNLKAVDVAMGTIGSKTDIQAIADNGNATAETTLTPGSLDLLWEADSYAPPLYNGKRFASPNSHVHAQALAWFKDASGNFIPSKDIVYTWHRNGGTLVAQSGRGKDSIVVPAPLLYGVDTISVDASTLDYSTTANAQVNVPAVDPNILLYQDHPLFGILYNRALTGSLALPDSEVTFAAVPLFAPVLSASDAAFRYQWSVNGTPVTADPKLPNEITIHAQNNSGTANLALTLQHSSDIFLDASGSWRITLNSSAATALDNPFGSQTN